MAANPNLIGGGRYTRAEVSGDTRRFQGKKLNHKALLFRLWKYLGRSRLLILLALFLSISGSLFSLYGPKLSGQAINAIDVSAGKVNFATVYRCAVLMAVFYLLAAVPPRVEPEEPDNPDRDPETCCGRRRSRLR